MIIDQLPISVQCFAVGRHREIMAKSVQLRRLQERKQRLWAHPTQGYAYISCWYPAQYYTGSLTHSHVFAWYSPMELQSVFCVSVFYFDPLDVPARFDYAHACFKCVKIHLCNIQLNYTLHVTIHNSYLPFLHTPKTYPGEETVIRPFERVPPSRRRGWAFSSKAHFCRVLFIVWAEPPSRSYMVLVVFCETAIIHIALSFLFSLTTIYCGWNICFGRNSNRILTVLWQNSILLCTHLDLQILHISKYSWH
jgi:hypothetical protein